MISIFIYNIFLIILYSITMTLSFYSFIKSKISYFLYTSLYFVVLTIDNVIVYMTEFIHPFARNYDQLFMILPLPKTFILVAYAYLGFAICTKLVQKNRSLYPLVLSIGLLAYLLLVPFLFSGALKVWLYYFPSQLCLAFFGVYLLVNLKQSSIKPLIQKRIKFLAFLLLFFAGLILLEDTYVIFFRDHYSPVLIQINNRSYSEDLFSISICLLFLRSIRQKLSSLDHRNMPAFPSIDTTSSLIDFCSAYQLTQREKEIFALLYQHQSNQEIANQLFLSLGTVKTHVHNIFVKLEIHKRNEIYSCYEVFIQNHPHNNEPKGMADRQRSS